MGGWVRDFPCHYPSDPPTHPPTLILLTQVFSFLHVIVISLLVSPKVVLALAPYLQHPVC